MSSVTINIHKEAYKVKLEEGKMWLYDTVGNKVPLTIDINVEQKLDDHNDGMAVCTVSMLVSLK